MEQLKRKNAELCAENERLKISVGKLLEEQTKLQSEALERASSMMALNLEVEDHRKKAERMGWGNFQWLMEDQNNDES
eukprot:8638809-Prorocentrum_lima.AAC.1